MSETKAEYYAKHLANQIVTQVAEQVEPIQSTLPELLAHMVTEFQVGLGEQVGDLHETLAEHFTICLLACAQPLLTEYLSKLANPPSLVVKQQEEPAPPQWNLGLEREYQQYLLSGHDSTYAHWFATR